MKEGNFKIAKNTVIIAVMILTIIIHDNVDEDEDDIMTTAVIIMTMIKVNAVLPHWWARVWVRLSLMTHLTSWAILLQFSN